MNYLIYLFNYVYKISDNKKRLELIIKLLTFDLLFTILFYITFTGGNGLIYNPKGIYSNFFNNVFPILHIMLIWILFEEITSRLPISFFINKSLNIKIKIYLIFILSFIFSFLHLPNIGFWEVVVIFPPIFVGGIIYSLIYILAGANKGKIFLPLIVVFLIHLVWDIVAFSLIGIPGQL